MVFLNIRPTLLTNRPLTAQLPLTASSHHHYEQYLAYADVQDRFLQLDKIALDTYPTYWPNVIISFFLAAVLSASVAGIVQTGTNFAVVGQGGCFLLPITIVLWAKIRKETKARARKRVCVHKDERRNTMCPETK